MKMIERIKMKIFRGDLNKFNIGHPLSFLWNDKSGCLKENSGDHANRQQDRDCPAARDESILTAPASHLRAPRVIDWQSQSAHRSRRLFNV
jgi:hypothetical protein